MTSYFAKIYSRGHWRSYEVKNHDKLSKSQIFEINSSVRSKLSIFIVSSQIIRQNEASGVSFQVSFTRCTGSWGILAWGEGQLREVPLGGSATWGKCQLAEVPVGGL